MIGIAVITHCHLGDALIEAAEFVMGNKAEAVLSVSININEPAEKLRAKIADAIKSVNQKKGVLILTDMFGGTPSNLSYSFLEPGRVEVVSGVNLPMLIKALNSRKTMELGVLAETVETYGKKGISLASSILKGNKRN